MSDYHVGCGVFGIYAGTLRPNGILWRNKSDVTKEATASVAQYLLENKKEMRFSYKGERYVLKVEKIKEMHEEVSQCRLLNRSPILKPVLNSSPRSASCSPRSSTAM